MGEDIFKIFRNKEAKIGYSSYMIKDLTAKELLLFKKECITDMHMMTSKDIVTRSDAELMILFEKLTHDLNNCLLGIFTENKLIARISLYNYNRRNSSVELGYILHESYQGRGIMVNALAYMLDKLFLNIKLNKVYCQTASFNRRSCALLKKCGFVQEGVLREHHEYEGKLFDDYLFSILRREWKNM